MPIVTIVIPTLGLRPSLLKRAIESTRISDRTIYIQVIVVINNPSVTTFPFLDDIKVSERFTIHILNLTRSNVSAARNFGISHAEGELLRFLDDDDFLIPEVASHQYRQLFNSDADLSTYAGRIEDSEGNIHQIIKPGNHLDYACAVLSPNCPALTFATVYRISLIRDLKWNETWSTTEDEDWMREILRSQPPLWISNSEVVGVWYQHQSGRLSKPIPTQTYYKNRALSIMETVNRQESEHRLEQPHRRAAAMGLWSAIHGGFYFAPLYWTRVARQAKRLDASVRPTDPWFKLLSPLPAIAIEWLTLPKRWLNHFMRLARGKILGWSHIRKLP